MTAPTAPTGGNAPDSATERPTKVLPTDRVRHQKQLDLLRAYAAVSGQGGKAATLTEVATVAALNPSTLSLCNGFFVDVGLLDRVATGGFIPAPELMQFQRAHAWNADTAAHKLAPLFRRTWFYQRLAPRLAMGPIDRTEAIQYFADAANAHKKYENQLAMLLDYLESSGLVRRDGDQYRAVAAAEFDVGGDDDPLAPPTLGGTRDSAVDTRPIAAPAATPVASAPTPGIHCNIDVSVDMAELGTWGADRITAFFAGVAQVLAAKSGTGQKS